MASQSIFNLPNQLTTLRLLLAVVMFGFLHAEFYFTSMALFIVAAGTDWLDGYFARKYGQVTTLGRILDPFADKVIVCGTFIFLAAIAPLTNALPPADAAVSLPAWKWGLQPWMVVVIVGRELLVTALRSFLEDRGADFSANWAGKWKMLLQCVAAVALLAYLWMAQSAPPPLWAYVTMAAATWAAVLSTIYSGAIYVVVAVRLLRSMRLDR